MFIYNYGIYKKEQWYWSRYRGLRLALQLGSVTAAVLVLSYLILQGRW